MVSSLYSKADENKIIWIYLEQADGVLESVSLELLCKGREMADSAGWQLAGLLLGHGVAGLVDQAFDCGADQVWLAEHSLLAHFTIDAYARVAFHAIMEGKPSVFLLGATSSGRDLAGRLAVRLRTGLSADCSGLHLDGEVGLLVSEVSGFGGGVLALIESRVHRPQMVTVRPGVFAIGEIRSRRTGKLVRIQVDLVDEMIQTRIVEQELGAGIDLTKAPVLVAGGRGIDGDFEMLKVLAELLGGEVGATRPPVDEGYIERERQIGQTGIVCRPKVAICCGISGAFHFIVGIEKAEMVIAINSDPEAPIFEFADYCIVGDVHEIIPALIEALRTRQEVTYA